MLTPPPPASTCALRQHLHALEAALRQAGLWQVAPPPAGALASTMPFMYDTLRVEQWLQWVFIPRLHALLDAGATLPGSCSVHPLAEHEWSEHLRTPHAPTAAALRQALHTLQAIDRGLSDTLHA